MLYLLSENNDHEAMYTALARHTCAIEIVGDTIRVSANNRPGQYWNASEPVWKSISPSCPQSTARKRFAPLFPIASRRTSLRSLKTGALVDAYVENRCHKRTSSTAMIVVHSKIPMPTAEAEMSLTTLILGFSLISIKSHKASIALLNNSAIRTSAVAVSIKKKSCQYPVEFHHHLSFSKNCQ